MTAYNTLLKNNFKVKVLEEIRKNYLGKTTEVSHTKLVELEKIALHA